MLSVFVYSAHMLMHTFQGPTDMSTQQKQQYGPGKIMEHVHYFLSHSNSVTSCVRKIV
jgi:hypothetical protein